MSYDKKIVVPVKLFQALLKDPLNATDGYSRLEAFINLLDAVTSASENSEAIFNGETYSLAPGQVAISVKSLEKKWNWDKESVRYFLQTLSALDVISYETHGQVIIFSFPFLDSFLIVDSEEFFPESLPCLSKSS
ncbi:MAG: hypothetical protein J1F67_11610 [Muribaculaceae bacterium]|nr:hypothetical protein [Muribaculaceae bacterium]